MRFLLALLLLLGAFATAQQTAPKNSPPNRGQQHEQADDKNVPSIPAHISGPSETNIQIQAPSPEQKPSNWVDWFWPPEWANWGLVIVGIWAACIAIGTLKQIRQETIHTGDFAKAASLHAQAVINAERPWLVVAIFLDKDTPELCRFGCRNQGNTPAKIISVSAQIGFIDRPDNLPVPPDYSSRVAMPDLTMIVHADSFPIGQGVNPRSVIGGTTHEVLVLSAREFLVYFGSVVYRDTLYPESAPEGLHETRWCFVYQIGGDKMFLRGGPEEYNRYT